MHYHQTFEVNTNKSFSFLCLKTLQGVTTPNKLFSADRRFSMSKLIFFLDFGCGPVVVVEFAQYNHSLKGLPFFNTL